jgi:hypothetical protein
LGFLGAGPFGAESPISGYWIPLDFLGFSRPNRDFSMGYAGFSLNDFSSPFFPASARSPLFLTGKNAGSFMAQV